MNYFIWKAAFAQAEAEYTSASAAARAAGMGSGPCGTTPDAVKFSPSYRPIKARHDSAWHALQAINAIGAKQFARELRSERDARRAAKLASMKGAPIPT